MSEKFVDVIIRAYAKTPGLDYFIDGYWKTIMGQKPPVVLDVGYSGSVAIPGSGNFAETIKKIKSQNGGEFIRPFLKMKAAAFPVGYRTGRIAIVGFSAGCGAVKEILQGAEDRRLVDTAYYCDGMHAAWNQQAKRDDKGNLVAPFGVGQRLSRPDLSEPYISLVGMEGTIDFADLALQGKRLFVVTHSEVVPEYPSTSETAEAVQVAALQRKSDDAQSELFPMGFLGVDVHGVTIPTPDKSDENGPYWASNWNNGCPPGNTGWQAAKIRPPWPVKTFSHHGCYVRAGFGAMDSLNPSCEMRSNSHPAHIFQNDVVQKEFYRHVLSERWKVECTEEQAVSGLGQIARLLPSPIRKLSATQMTRLGGRIRRNPALLRAVSPDGLKGLGEIGESCFAEGIFSDILSPDEILQAKVQRVAIGASIIGLGYLAWQLLTQRQES